jgi:hypothetical protein
LSKNGLFQLAILAIFDGIVDEEEEENSMAGCVVKAPWEGSGGRLCFRSRPHGVDGRDTKQEFDLTDPKDGELWQ